MAECPPTITGAVGTFLVVEPGASRTDLRPGSGRSLEVSGSVLVGRGRAAVGELRLEVHDFAGPGRWRWVLTGPDGASLAQHEVRLDTGCWQYEAFTGLPGYLRWHVAPDRRIAQETEIVDAVGQWIGEQVFGPVGPAMVGQRPATVRLVVPVVPAEAAQLMFVPLELGHVGGRPVAAQDVTLVIQRAGAVADVARVGERLRVLGLFSLPAGGRPLNLRRERRALERLFAEIGAVGRAVDVQVRQYGVTRERLRDVLAEDEGWDVIHVSGHGAPGELRLETEDGSADPVRAAELVGLLGLARPRAKLVTLSACWSAAPTLAEQRRLLKLPVPGQAGRPEQSGAQEPGERPVGALAAELADRLGCAVLAMRFPVLDGFAIALAVKLYGLLAGNGLPLPEALGIVLKDQDVIAVPPTAGRPALSVATPALFGSRAVGLRLAAPECSGPVSSGIGALESAGFPAEPGRFVGRTRVMARASAALAPRSGASGVLLHGMPGGGKTACALELAYTHEHAFEKLVWFKAPDEGLGTVGALTRFALALETGLPGLQMVHLLDNPGQLAAFLPSLTALLERRRVLVTIDNIESLLTDGGTWRDERWGTVVAALCGHTGLGRVVLTGRRRPDGLDQRVRVEAVDALSLDEAMLLARELPNLGELMDGKLSGMDPNEARMLARRVLEVAQGHPKLLELADGQAAHPDQLRKLIETADVAWYQAGGLPEGFFTSGETRTSGQEYGHVLAAWTQAAAAESAPAERDLFEFLCCLEEVDRIRFALDITWPHLWRELGRAGDPPGLDGGLAPLSAAGLLAVQSGHAEAVASYRIHPAVAAAGRGLAGAAFREVVDNSLAGCWSAAAGHARVREAKAQAGGGWVVWAGIKAVPYLLRLHRCAEARTLLDAALARDRSPQTAAEMLPALREIAEAAAGSADEPVAIGLLAQAQARTSPTATERRMRELLAAALARADFLDASASAGDLAGYLTQAGRLGEALTLAEENVTYIRRAGLGPWSQLGGDMQRLQVLAALGQSEQVLIEMRQLREHMDGLPPTSDQPEIVEPWNIREALYDVGREAARSLGRWDEALKLNALVTASKRGRAASDTDIAETRFNDYGPLIERSRLTEALKLLVECRVVFERAHDIGMLGKVFGALADVEAKRGHGEVATSLVRDALRYSYSVGDVGNIEVCHHNLGDRLHLAGEPGAALAHHLAAALLRVVTRAGSSDDVDDEDVADDVVLAAADLGLPSGDTTVPADVAELCSRVSAVPGVDLDRLLAGLVPDRPAVEQALAELTDHASRVADSMAASSAPVSATAAATDAVPQAMARWLAEWDAVIAGLVAAAQGNQQAATQVEQYLILFQDSSDWATLAGALRRIQGGDRSQSLTAGLDGIDAAIVGRALSVLSGEASVPAAAAWPAMGLGPLLGDVVAAGHGDTAAAERARQDLPTLTAAPDWAALSHVLDRILGGERGPGLAAALADATHRAVVVAVLHYIGAS
jgi:CHAT domain